MYSHLFSGSARLFMGLQVVCSGIAKNAKNACAKSLGTVHGVYDEGEPSVGLFV